MIRIDRCHCFQVGFADLKEIASETGAGSVEELQQHVAFGLRCRLCHPYVRRMLATGETEFHEVIVEGEANS